MRIMWFRRDLRLADNEALADAVSSREPVVCLHVAPSGAAAHARVSGEWLDASLEALGASLTARGSALVRRTGEAAREVAALAEECGATAVHCTRDWSPAGREEESRVAEALRGAGRTLIAAEGAYLVPPAGLATRAGGPHRVFSPYHRAWLSAWAQRAPLEAPGVIPAPERIPASHPAVSSAGSRTALPEGWRPGEDGAADALARFVGGPLRSYAEDRDLPAVRGTSELSAHLAFGEISPRTVAWAVQDAGAPEAEAGPFLRQLAWREFSAHLLHHFPDMATSPLQPRFAEFPWNDDERLLEAWKRGETGYPLVDAGMRQLAQTGWMHNRARLGCGSFLAKHLLIPWQRGLAWFEESLHDHDPATNAFNWQWVAGSGADAAPYFRILSPIRQGERFDPLGEYVRAWVPELREVPARWIHRPWEAPGSELSAVGVVLGRTYPLPMVDHSEARARALAAYAAIRR